MVASSLNKIFVIFIAVSATLVATSNAAQRARFVTISVARDGQINKEIPRKIWNDEESTVSGVHERMLRMNTHDYGRYDPNPPLSKPRYKLIPN